MPPKVTPKVTPKVAPKPTAAPPTKPAAEKRSVAGSIKPEPSSVRTGQRNAQAKDFGDDSIKGGYNDRPEAFRGKAGITYIMRIVTLPVAYFGSYIQNKSDPSKSFFMQSRADYDLSAAAFDGDADAEAKASEQCPLWERKEKMQQKFVSGIFLVGKEDSKGRFEKIGTFYPWSFGGERYAGLTNLCRSLPTKADGTRISIKAVEIRAQCTDDKYQKFSLAAVTTPRDFKMTWAQVWEEVKGFFEGDSNSPCEKIEEFLKPDSKRDMIASLDRAYGKSQDAVEEVEDAPAPTAKKGAKPGTRKADPEPEEVAEESGDSVEEELDSALEGLTGDAEGEGEAEVGDELEDVQ